MHVTLILIRFSILLTLIALANVSTTSPAQITIPTHGGIIYQNDNDSGGMFGNLKIGNDVGMLSSDMWGSFFECPEDGYAKNITAYVKTENNPSRLRCALYEEYVHTPPPPMTVKYMRFVMSTEEKIVPAHFEGWATLNFTAPPPTKRGTVYWLCAWSDEYTSMMIAQDRTKGTGIEWTVYMAGQPHGLGYPHFYEIVPQNRRATVLCSIYCTYDFEPPSSYICPYCRQVFSTYEELLEHIVTTPLEMIRYYICDVPGCVSWCCHLKEELQQHMFEEHGIGSPPDHYSCIFCNFTANTPEEVYTHITDTHAPFTGLPEEGS